MWRLQFYCALHLNCVTFDQIGVGQRTYFYSYNLFYIWSDTIITYLVQMIQLVNIYCYLFNKSYRNFDTNIFSLTSQTLLTFGQVHWQDVISDLKHNHHLHYFGLETIYIVCCAWLRHGKSNFSHLTKKTYLLVLI